MFFKVSALVCVNVSNALTINLTQEDVVVPPDVSKTPGFRLVRTSCPDEKHCLPVLSTPLINMSKVPLMPGSGSSASTTAFPVASKQIKLNWQLITKVVFAAMGELEDSVGFCANMVGIRKSLMFGIGICAEKPVQSKTKIPSALKMVLFLAEELIR